MVPLLLLLAAVTLDQQAYRAYQQRDWAAAARLYEAFHASAPGNPSTYDNLGVALTNLGRWNQAEAALRRAIELNSRHRWAYNHLGFVYREQGRYPQAIDMFQRQISVSPQDPYAYRNLAATLVAVGRLEEADRAAGLYEKYGYERGAAYIDMACNLNARNHPAQAWQYLERAQAAGVERSLLAQERAHYFLTIQDHAQAEAEYLKLLEYRPYDSIVALRLGALYFQTGSLEKSAAMFGRVLDVDENDRVTIHTSANTWRTIALSELRSDRAAGAAMLGELPVDLGGAALLVRLNQRRQKYAASQSEQNRNSLRTACEDFIPTLKSPESSWLRETCATGK